MILFDSDYEALVVDEARGRLEPGTDTKPLTDDLERWRCMLVNLLHANDSQLRNCEIDRVELWCNPPSRWKLQQEKVKELKARRGRALHHRRKLEQRLREVNVMIATKRREEADSVRVLFRDLAVFLLAQVGEFDRTAVPDLLRPAFDIAVRLIDQRSAA